MKQKYVLMKNDENDKLIIQEYAELDKGGLSFLCEEFYDRHQIESAMAKGKGSLITSLRTENMFPCGSFVDRLAESVITLYASNVPQPVEIFFNDIELLNNDQQLVEEIEDEAAEIEDLLDDKFEDDYEDEPSLDNIGSSLKIADDEALDIGSEE